MLRLSLFLLASCVVTSHPVTVRQTGAGTAVVNLGNNTGSPAHLASGILYGIPDNQDQMPNHFFTDIGFNYARAGGAQEPAPARGWIWGLDEYKAGLSLAHFSILMITGSRTASLPRCPTIKKLGS